MKTFFVFTCLAMFCVPAAQADHAPPTACHALKYDSYFVAQNVKGNLKRLNPDVSQPNFAQHFLLMRTELTMETLYLIASCETGEFFHEKITADQAKFSLTSNQVDFSTHDGESTHYEWDGNSWIKGATLTEAGINPPASTATSDQPISTGPVIPSASLSLAYDALFSAHSASAEVDLTQTCAKLDYSSFFRAQNNQESIEKSHSDLSHPNFAGRWLLLKTETLFDALYLIADCKTGKFSDELIKGNLLFKPTSKLVISKSATQTPELSVWTGDQWIHIPDTVQNKKDKKTNVLYGDKASILAKSLPNPHHLDSVRFEALKAVPETQTLFQDLSVETITSGVCHIPTGKKPTCEIETQ